MFVNQNGQIALSQLGIYDMIIKKLSQKTGLTEDTIYKMMGMDHLYKKHYKKKDLKKVDIDFSYDKKKVAGHLTLISKTLKISLDAVIVTLLMEQIKEKTKK